MRKMLLPLVSLVFAIDSKVQTMRRVDDLINTQDPGWPLVQQWIAAATNKVEVLPCDTAKARTALYKAQVTTRSPMGAIVYSTRGIMVDDGWIGILGSGSDRLSRSLPDWNEGKARNEGGGLGKDAGKVYYPSPDDLEWQATDLTYTDFLNFCFTRDLDKFYKGLRWKDWRKEVAARAAESPYRSRSSIRIRWI